MKTLQKISCIALIMIGVATQAQVSVNVNVGTPPTWAPTTPAGVEYYYLPDVDSYYDIRTTEYIYVDNGNWIRSRSLPAAYRTYVPSKSRTIVINDYHGRSPYVNYKVHKVKYKKFKPGKKVVVVKPGKGHGRHK